MDCLKGSCSRRIGPPAYGKETNEPRAWDLLKRFGESAPAPMLLNTSFNLFGEPLVVSPLDAIRSYACSGIDALPDG